MEILIYWVTVILLYISLCNGEIPGLSHYSQEQQSILADHRILQSVGQAKVIYVPVPVCGECHNKYRQIIIARENCNDNNQIHLNHQQVATNHNYDDKSPHIAAQTTHQNQKAIVHQAYVNYNDNYHQQDHVNDGQDSEYHHLHKKNHNVNYRFEYAVNARKTGDIKHHIEERKGDVVRGEYSLVEEDGNVRTVKYYADWKTGFHAQVYNSKSQHVG